MKLKNLVVVVVFLLICLCSTVALANEKLTQEFTREGIKYRVIIDFSTGIIRLEKLVNKIWFYDPTKQVEKRLEYPTKTYLTMKQELSKCPLKRGIYIKYIYENRKEYPQIYICSRDHDVKSCALYTMGGGVLSEVCGDQYYSD